MTDLITQDNTPANLPQLELEIKFYLGQTAQNIIEVGKRLIQAKSLVQHGQWQAWLEQNFQLSQQTARKFMQVAERFTETRIDTRFNSTQMIQLLSLPSAEETEKFIAEKAAEGKKVADMTIKELRAEINAMKNLNLAKEVHEQKLREGQEIGKLVLLAEARLGELFKLMPKATSENNLNGRAGKQFPPAGKLVNNESESEEEEPPPKPKLEVAAQMGFNKNQVAQFQTLADNPEIVNQTIAEAKENDF